jgi:hypothetical protein
MISKLTLLLFYPSTLTIKKESTSEVPGGSAADPYPSVTLMRIWIRKSDPDIDYHAVPDPAFHSDADPDPAHQNDAAPDPQHR